MNDRPTAEPLGELLTDAAAASAHPHLKTWYSPAQLKRNFADFLAPDLKRLDDLDLASQFQRHCPVHGATPNDYRNRLLALAGSGWALIGIRFKDLDLARPFVALLATSRPLGWPAELKQVMDEAAASYRLFEPKHVRAFAPAHEELDLSRLHPGAFWERRLLAAPLSVMQSLPLPQHHARIALERATDLSFYDRYRAAYDELHADHPKHREYAPVESPDDMRYYLEMGQVYEVYVDSRWAGVVGCYPYSEQGLGGVTVAEMFLDSAHRGQRLGAAMQRRFVDELDPALGVMWGSIDGGNAAAIRTALSCGRSDLGGYFYVPSR